MSMRRRVVAGFAVLMTLFLALVVVQLVVLYAPRTPSGGGLLHADKVVHALVFGAVLVAARRCALPRLPVAAALLVHAVVSELVQHHLLPGRSGDPLDLAADAAGVLLAALVPLRADGRRHRPGRPAAAPPPDRAGTMAG